MATKFLMIWKTASQILEIDKVTKVTQVYTWILTKDEKLALVSKNDIDWQFPGGKPESNETSIETAQRETMEEVGLDISENKSDLKFFGYYLVYEFDLETNKILDSFLQLRYKLDLTKDFSELELNPTEVATAQKENEKIKHAKFFTMEEAFQKIKWLEKSDEYIAYSAN